MAKVTSVEYVVSPAVAARFAEAKKKIKGVNKPVLAFHGTADANIPLITASGFKMPGKEGHKHATDTGWYGKGIYFSEYPAYSMGYIKGSTRLLLCQVLLGRVYKCTKLIHGAALQSGYDAHSSPDGKELVIFDSAHILPCYIVNFSNTPSEFTYASDEDELSAVTSSDSVAKKLNASMEAALVKSGSTALKPFLFLLAGKYDLKQAAIKQLIEKHAGQVCLKRPKSTDRTLCLLATEKSVSSAALQAKVQEVLDEGGKIVNQTFVYERILNPKKTDISEYELEP